MIGGDRRLDTLGFTGTSSVFTDADFTRFTNGSLTNNAGTFGWNATVTRDINTSGNSIWANPDRADNATPFAGEPGAVGTIGEVFGSSMGFKNMSYLIDAEDNRGWTIDLLFGGHSIISADSDASTAEVAFIERGGNSDFKVYGLLADQTTTAALFVSRKMMGATGWSLNSLEIGSAQKVYAVGISLDASWQNLVGLRLEAVASNNGPDILGVGTIATIPAPGAVCALALAFLTFGRRRRSH